MTARCDFCSTPAAVLTFYAAEETSLVFSGPGGTRRLRLDGAWAACPPCRRLIDANDRIGLLARAHKRCRLRTPLTLGTLVAVQSAFFRSRRGRAA